MAPRLPTKGAYPADWREVATAIKAEVGQRCARCGEMHAPSTGYTLTVHHFDGDKANCERWNLMPLCQRCHLSVQSRVNPETPLLIEPADWARPYIAGFYESGRGMPGPTYDLAAWIEKYEEAIGPWPEWAAREGGDGEQGKEGD